MPKWWHVARSEQLPPREAWRQWLLIGGRGSGKTRAGAEWVTGMALGLSPFASGPHRRIALVAETLADAREVMIEGESGLKAIVGYQRPVFEVTRRRLVFANGATAQIFSSEDPDSIRGYQFDAAWGDELGKWVRAEESFDNLMLALRLGEKPRALFTTTPRNVPILKRLLADPQTSVTRMRTAANAENLAPGFLEAMARRYGGTRLGRQELDGELLADREDALFERSMIESGRMAAAPPLKRIVVAVDPPATSTKRSDACGIVAAGKGADGVIYVVADESRRSVKPERWARCAVALFERLEADRIVAEVNQGGDMVEAVLRTVAPDIPYHAVRATRGKWTRAEPVAALYEQGRVRHVGRFPELEDEMADFATDGLSDGRSPDRLDALVWAVTALTGDEAEPRVRNL
ncbi:terminase family protein [Fulvimarina sp. MAC8]|uniref:DNA-packaging protein n=1 Tax=Fulvimarina sp. MAC8 TaxID=3162874 RepID=UPI0032EE2FD5